MKWSKILGLSLGLVAGMLWLAFGLASAVGLESFAFIFPVIVQSFLVGVAVVVSTLIAWRWHIPGGVLLLLEGIAPLISLFLRDVSYPLFFIIVSGLTLLSGILFLVTREKP